MSTHDNAINRGTWDYSEPIWFNARLKPHSHPCTLLHIIYFMLSYFCLPHSESFSLFSTSLVLILSTFSTIPDILGMRIKRNRMMKTLRLSQSDYIQVLRWFNMENAKQTSTPLLMSTWLTDMDSPSIDKKRELNGKIPYASTIGSIMYVMATTQPDLALAVMVVNWYMSHPRRKHWEAIKNIFGYLWGTKDVQLTFGSDNRTEVEGYTDSDYADNPNNRKPTSSYKFTYGGGAISWRSKLQECMTL